MRALNSGLSAVLGIAAEQEISHDNKQYKARVSSRQIRVNLDNFGWTNISTCTVYCNNDMYAGETLIYDKVEYRIMQKTTYTQSLYKYECEQKF